MDEALDEKTQHALHRVGALHQAVVDGRELRARLLAEPEILPGSPEAWLALLNFLIEGALTEAGRQQALAWGPEASPPEP